MSTVPDELLKSVTNVHLVRQVRSLAPDATIIACATRATDAVGLQAAGADHVFRPPTEAALGVLPAIYAALDGNLPSYLEASTEAHGALARRGEVID